MPRYACPFPEYKDAWVERPEKWLGKHAVRYETARVNLNPTWPGVFQEFALSMVLLEDWFIPGLTGKPENWDLTALDLQLMAWVNALGTRSYLACFQVPKNGLRPLQNGQVTALTNAPQPGTLEATPMS